MEQNLYPFTLVIDSTKRLNINDNTNDCYVKINCPQLIQTNYECEVFLFSLAFPTDNVPAASYIKLVCDELNIKNQFSNNAKKILSIYDNRNYRYSRLKFESENFNGKELRFQLLTENDTPLLNTDGNAYNYPWNLIIECYPKLYP